MLCLTWPLSSGAAAVIILGHAAMLEPGLEGDFASGPVQV
jgi:hypothetical protein